MIESVNNERVKNIIKLKNTVLINALKMNQRYFMVINILLMAKLYKKNICRR